MIRQSLQLDHLIVRKAGSGSSGTLLVLAMLSFPALLRAQDGMRRGRRDAEPVNRLAPHCRIVCDPVIALMPALIHTHLRGGPLVRSTSTNVTHRLPSSTDAEIIVSVAARTAIPRVSVFGSMQWLPNASAQRNPFTLYTANELGEPVRANAPTATAGASFTLVPATATKGWADLAVNVGDLFSQAARPGDASAYTHKLDLGLVGHAGVFAWVPRQTYLHRVQLFGLVDYVATGLPSAGDEVPLGRRFMSDARPLSLIAGLTLPLSPPVR